MSVKLGVLKNCDVSPFEAKQELDRLLDDSRFRATERQRHILTYLADCQFSGCESRVKAYSIAIDVLGRNSDFDASTDPIVRIEISRLRSSLDSYYEAFGADSNITICIPKGMYVATFRSTSAPLAVPRDSVPEATAMPTDSDHALDEVATRTAGSSTWSWIGGTAALTLALAASAVANVWWADDTPHLIRKPVVHLSVAAADGSMAGEANQLRDTLTTALTRFSTLTVAETSDPEGSRDGRRYELQVKYYGSGNDHKIWWQIVESDNDLVLKSGVEAVDSGGMSMNAVREQMAGRLAYRLASARGVINTMEIAQDPNEALGNKCILRAESALDQGGLERLESSRKCLEKTLARSRDEADAAALLSRILLAGKDAAQQPAVRLRAFSLAKNAVSLAPRSDRAQIALMAAQFADGNMDAALMAGNRAVELNPYNADSTAKLAFIFYLAERREEGVMLAREAVEAGTDEPPSEAMLVLALDAYRSARYSEASLFAERITGTDFLVATLRTAALGQLNSPAAHDRLSQLAGNHSGFAAGFRNGLSWWRQEQGILNDLQAGLIKASGNAQRDMAADR